MYFKVKNRKIKVFWKWSEIDSITYKIQFGMIMFLIPCDSGFNILELQECLRQDSEWVLENVELTKSMYLVHRTRHELFLILKKYVSKWEQIMGVKVFRIRISAKPTKWEWAHCSGRGYLSFSSGCVELPEHILEVLVVHEMNHIRHKGHGKDFWDDFERYLPGARERDKEIDLYVDLEEELKKYVG